MMGKESLGTRSGRKRRSSDKVEGSAEKKLPDEDETKKTGADRRKSKRRSSFVLGRIQSESYYPTARSTELARNVPEDLPEAERLQKLCEVVLEYSLDKLDEDLSDLAGWQQFKVEATDKTNSLMDRLEKEGAFTRATEQPCHSNKRANNTEADKYIKDLKGYMNKLRTESKAWDDLVENHTSMADDAERQSKNSGADTHLIQPSLDELMGEQRGFLKEDLNVHLTKIDHLKKKAVLAVDKMEQSCKVLEAFTSTANTVLEEQASVLHASSFTNLDQSPKKMLLAAAQT